MKLVDLSVELRNELIESLFECFHVCVLCRLDICNYGGELTDELNALSVVVLVFLLYLELELCQCVVKLPIEIDLVSVVLEVLVGVVHVVVLLHEVFHSSHRFLQISDALLQPLL